MKAYEVDTVVGFSKYTPVIVHLALAKITAQNLPKSKVSKWMKVESTAKGAMWRNGYASHRSLSLAISVGDAHKALEIWGDAELVVTREQGKPEEELQRGKGEVEN